MVNIYLAVHEIENSTLIGGDLEASSILPFFLML
jgi:hypothetical protein